MIQFNSTVIGLLSNPVISVFYLVRVADYYTTSHYNNITLTNGQTYIADGKILQADAPRLSPTVDRELYRVSFADPDYSLTGIVGDGIVGQPFEVRLCFIDPTTNAPYTNISDTLLAYKGVVDNVSYSISLGNLGETVAVVSGASPMADLDATRAYYSSKEFIKEIDPNDSSFDQIYEGAGPINLRWGRV